jgi:hypothetical protein
LPQYSSAIVGNSDLVIHSQIAARLPRDIWPELASSAARSTKRISMGLKKWRDRRGFGIHRCCETPCAVPPG